MKLVTFEHQGRSRLGVLQDNDVVDLSAAWGREESAPTSMVALLQGGAATLAHARRTVDSASATMRLPRDSVRLLAPISRPPKIICSGINYRDHAEEGGAAIPTIPIFFSKPATTIIGPGTPIVLPAESQQVDYEAELAIVIGARCRHLTPQTARDAIAGYTAFNDVSARDWQVRTSQWFIGKAFDTFAPIGPALVTADEIPDPHGLDISLKLNDQEMQRSNTRHFIFGIDVLLVEISKVMTLEPGDIIATGTPAGVGFARKPPVFLRPGDSVSVSIAGIGSLSNPVVAAPETA